MEKRLQEVTEPKEMEFFSIEPDGKGGKQIHVLGYCYASDSDDVVAGCFWRNVEYTFFIEPLEEFIEHLKENEDYVGNTAGEVKQYMSDECEESIVDIINHYFDGKTANAKLRYSDITMDTPCGDYIC